ncbi:MAG: hypothetical protein Q4F00_01635 [bacterium]|nr:hypothetical protein [bacterium]
MADSTRNPHQALTEQEQRDIVAQWAFDVRPLLLRFHLYLENVQTTWIRGGRTSETLLEMSFLNGRIERLMALTAAVTALGTKLYGRFGDGKNLDKVRINAVKKDSDAISAYAMSESLWHLSRSLPENHAIMVCLGEGLMPKGGETPEMGSNPQLGFGRVYARPEVAQILDKLIVRLLNDADFTWEQFYAEVKRRGITIWGTAIDTLENTTRFARGENVGPMTILHIFDQPMSITRPYEGYMGTLIVPQAVIDTAEKDSILINYRTDRRLVMEAIRRTYPGLKPEKLHVWTLGGTSREPRLASLWKQWEDLGAHVIEDGWITSEGIPSFNDSGTYAPTYHVKTWRDASGDLNLMVIDGYAASAEASQAATVARSLGLAASLCVLTSKCAFDWQIEREIMRLNADADDFASQLQALTGCAVDDEMAASYRRMIHECVQANIPLKRSVMEAGDLFPEKEWRSLAVCGYMCADPYTGASGVRQLEENVYEVTVRLVSEEADKLVTFALRLNETPGQERLVFNPLLNRFMAGEDYRSRPVRISDSGRIRNELQTLCAEALEFPSSQEIVVHFNKISPALISAENQGKLREILSWYKQRHPYWFKWLSVQD